MVIKLLFKELGGFINSDRPLESEYHLIAGGLMTKVTEVFGLLSKEQTCKQ